MRTMDTEMREAATQIATQREITQEQAEALVMGAESFWQALEMPGFVDGFGGSEFCRIFPEVIEAIHGLANPSLESLTEELTPYDRSLRAL